MAETEKRNTIAVLAAEGLKGKRNSCGLVYLDGAGEPASVSLSSASISLDASTEFVFLFSETFSRDRSVLAKSVKAEIIDLKKLAAYFLPGPGLSNLASLPPAGRITGAVALLLNIIRSLGKNSLVADMVLKMVQVQENAVPEMKAIAAVVRAGRAIEFSQGTLSFFPQMPNNSESPESWEFPPVSLARPAGKSLKPARRRHSLSDRALSSLLETGYLREFLPAYVPRKGQGKYAAAVGDAFNAVGHYYLEAPTGIGKTLGYLVPSAAFLERNPTRRVIIATATKNLQKQVLEDWDALRKRYPDIRITSLKGKGNYICLSALASCRSIYLQETPEKALAWFHLLILAELAEGDLERIDPVVKKWLPALQKVIADCRADLHCSKTVCSRHNCPYRIQVSLAAQSNIIVTSHYKLLSMEEKLLNGCEAVFVDEAERFSESARSTLETVIDSLTVNNLLYRMCGSDKRRGFLKVLEDKKRMDGNTGSADLLRDAAAGMAEFRLRIGELVRKVESGQPNSWSMLGWHSAFRQNGLHQLTAAVQAPLKEAAAMLDIVIKESDKGSNSHRLNTYATQVVQLASKIEEFAQGFNTAAAAHSYRREGQAWEFVRTPIDAGSLLNEMVYSKVPAVVFTSASLFTGGTSRFQEKENGSSLAGVPVVSRKFDPVFDYVRSAVAIIDGSVPSYRYNADGRAAKDYRQGIVDAVRDYTVAAGGRTLVLFMSVLEMRHTFQFLKGEFTRKNILPIIQNGSSAHETELFRYTENSVLFGVDRFWAGVDFPGSTLSQVIIAKAPNPALSNPVIAHRRAWEDDFMEEIYPNYGAMKLRQGAGRLLRRDTDTGAVIILDSRYGVDNRLRLHIESIPMPLVKVASRLEGLRIAGNYISRRKSTSSFLRGQNKDLATFPLSIAMPPVG